MPIEIKELIVRIVVQDKPQPPLQVQNSPPVISIKRIVDECVEKVMDKLESRMER